MEESPAAFREITPFVVHALKRLVDGVMLESDVIIGAVTRFGSRVSLWTCANARSERTTFGQEILTIEECPGEIFSLSVVVLYGVRDDCAAASANALDVGLHYLSFQGSPYGCKPKAQANRTDSCRCGFWR